MLTLSSLLVAAADTQRNGIATSTNGWRAPDPDFAIMSDVNESTPPCTLLGGDGSRNQPYVIGPTSCLVSTAMQMLIIGQVYGPGEYSSDSKQRRYYESPRGAPANKDLCEHILLKTGRSVWFDLSEVAKYHATHPNANEESMRMLGTDTSDIALLKTKWEPDNAETYFNRGIAKRDKGDLDGAIAEFTKVIQLEPDYAEAYYNRGVMKQGKGDDDGAIADYNNAIQIKPDHASAYNNRGAAKQGKGDLGGAIEDYTKAIQIEPEHASAYHNRGLVKQGRGDLDDAILDCTKAIALKPDYVEAYVTRGLAQAIKGDLDAAILDYTKAIQLKPDHAEAYFNRCCAKKLKGDTDGAIADYTKAINLKPELAEPFIDKR